MRALIVETLTGGRHLIWFASAFDRAAFMADLDSELKPEGVTPLYVTSVTPYRLPENAGE
jgi:hypothetical protein